MPFETYKVLDAINNSQLKVYDKSPLLFRKTYIDQSIPEREETEALRQGSLTHCLLLEPAEFAVRYFPAPMKVDRRTKEGKALWASWQEECGARQLISADDYRECCALRDSVLAHKAASDLLNAPGASEVTILTELEGAKVKGRLDRYTDAGDVIDLKTCDDLDDFPWTIEARAYYRQLAWYRSLLRAGGHPYRASYLIAIEKEEPLRCEVYRIGEETLNAGEKQNQSTLKDLLSSLHTDYWPGGRADIIEINPTPKLLEKVYGDQQVVLPTT
jgi:hypothetical protein